MQVLIKLFQLIKIVMLFLTHNWIIYQFQKVLYYFYLNIINFVVALFKYFSFIFFLGSPKKVIQRRAVSMPGLEKETEVIEISKRNSSQTNCTMDSVFPVTTPLNVEGILNSDAANLNTSTSVVTTPGANKGKINQFKKNTIKCKVLLNLFIII